MTKDEIIALAREAGLPDPMVFYASYERFANRLYALAAERKQEACAKVCENLAMQQDWDVRDQCAAAIRARGNT